MKYINTTKWKAEQLNFQTENEYIFALILQDDNYKKEVNLYNYKTYSWELYYTTKETLPRIIKNLEEEKNIPEEYRLPKIKHEKKEKTGI